MKKYFKVWWQMTQNSFETIFSTRAGMLIFIFGKLFRLFLYLGFIYFLFSGIKQIANFSKDQILFFLITFMFLGSVGQMFFRAVYQFRSRIVSGDFDFDLAKPISPIFRNLFGGFDLLDLLTMPVLFGLLAKIIVNLNFSIWQLAVYILLCVNSLLIIGAIHVLVLALGVLKTEVDNAIMLYRDIETMGRFPVDIYKTPLREILTFVVPVGVMFTVPAKVLLGLTDPLGIIASLAVGIVSLIISLKFWNLAVKKYSSASS
jgi:ABC-2 type transport system permease protein